MAVGGLALANSVAVTVEVALCVWILHRRLGGIGGRALADGFARTTAATAAMAAAVWFVIRLLEPFAASAGHVPGALLVLGSAGAVGAGVYAVAAAAVGLTEARSAWTMARATVARVVRR
jgi:putative peptidoglycan lipid II flippase